MGQATIAGRAIGASLRLGMPRHARMRRLPLRRPRFEPIWIGLIGVVAGLAHGINMFGYPYFENDEGTYVSQAWSVITEHHLAPYTYFYDHAPLGWIQQGIFEALSGGFNALTSSVATGRIFMLVLHVGSVILLYLIAKRLSGSVVVATTAALLFSLSPFELDYGRRVLLDNITTFWMLASVLPLLSRRLSLNLVWVSAVAISIAILSKEIALFLVPVLAYTVYTVSDRSHRLIAVTGWCGIVAAVVSLYVVMAALKGELFPSGSALGGTAPHVSLLCTLEYQAARDHDGGIFDPHSLFWLSMRGWVTSEPVLVIGGALASVFLLASWRRQRRIALMGALTISLWLFLARGGEVIEFYLLPLIPFLALCLTLALWRLTGLLRSRVPAVVRTVGMRVLAVCAGLAAIVVATGPVYASGLTEAWTNHQTTPEMQAESWIEGHISTRAYMVIDEYLWLDLHNAGYAHADYYWKVERDPAIRDAVFQGDWRSIGYITVTPQLITDVRTQDMSILAAALEHSSSVADFDTDGFRVDIRSVDPNTPAHAMPGIAGPAQQASAAPPPASCMTATG